MLHAMQIQVGGARVELVRGDIVEQRVDAIVNAANTGLLGGGGVDGAIHRAAGPELLEACRALPADAQGRRCPTGEVRVTPGFLLPGRFVIHGVGPVYHAARAGESAALLRAVHRNALAAAKERGLSSVAFPAISTGVYGYPVRDAAEVALGTVREVLSADRGSLELVRFVLFSERDLETFTQVLAGGGAGSW